MRKTILFAAAVALTTVLCPAVAKEESEKGSPVVATVNGEAVTKAEWVSIWKADQWHAEELKKQPGYSSKMQGRPYEDFFFQEEVVKIRAMAQKYQEDLPAMKNAIDAIYQKAKAGEDFVELAKKYSQDAGEGRIQSTGRQETEHAGDNQRRAKPPRRELGRSLRPGSSCRLL